jgi:hypothetical protein
MFSLTEGLRQLGGFIVNSDKMVSVATAVMEEKEQDFLDGLIKDLSANSQFSPKRGRSYLMTYMYLGRYDIDINTHSKLMDISKGAKPFKVTCDKFVLVGKSNSIAVRMKMTPELKKLATKIRSTVETSFPNPDFEAQITLGTLAEGVTLKDIKTPSVTGKTVTVSGLRLVNSPVLNVKQNRDRGYSWIPKSERSVRTKRSNSNSNANSKKSPVKKAPVKKAPAKKTTKKK